MKVTVLVSIFFLSFLSAKAQSNIDVTTGKADTGKIYAFAEIFPEFPGGVTEFGKFISQNIRYPKIARQNKTEGKVIITFVIERDGSLSGIKVLRAVSKEIDEESVRVLHLSPNWKPGTQNGKPIRCAYTVPISFTLKQ